MRKSDLHDYFEKAQSWADDYQLAALTSRNRYQLAFFACVALCCLLIFLIICLLPLKTTQLIVVHQGSNGYNWVSLQQAGEQLKPNWLRSKAEIAHYISTRESYDPLLYREQINRVKLLSNTEVFNQFQLQQANNKFAPINLLAAKGYRSVTINSIFLLTKKTKTKDAIAQVNFVTHDHLFSGGASISTPYTALISWDYTGTPSNPQQALHDWDGFQVISYQVQASLSNKETS